MEQTSNKFNIDARDVSEHAPIVYQAIQEHYARIHKLIYFLSDNPKDHQDIISHSILFGILPNKEIKYEEIFLDIDEFKVAVIYHLCFSKSVECSLSWEAYVHTQEIFQDAFFKISKENIGIDSIMLKFFKVDPSVLPKSYVAKTMKVDEFNQAVVFIYGKVSELNRYNEGFNDYDDYFEYVKKAAIEITNECHAKDFWGTHEIDRFTCACISSRMKIPAIDMLYNVEGLGSFPHVEVDNIKDIQEKILTKMFDEYEEDGD